MDITSCSPNSGPGVGNTEVVVSGSGFADGVRVKFGIYFATDVVVESENTIRCYTPAHVSDPVDVVVNLDGQESVLRNGYIYVVVSQAKKRTKKANKHLKKHRHHGLM